MNDENEIRAIVADIETGLNTNDATLMTKHFAEDAVAVGGNGVALHGNAEILAAHKVGIAGFLRDSYARYEVEQVTFPAPDTALAWKTAQATDVLGSLLEETPSMRALYVLVRRDNGWQIVARQNTLIPPS